MKSPTPTPALTLRLLHVLALIASSIDARGYAPTLREICTLLRISSTHGASQHCGRLIALGFLEHRGGFASSRSLVITLLGRVLLATEAAQVRRLMTIQGAAMRWNAGHAVRTQGVVWAFEKTPVDPAMHGMHSDRTAASSQFFAEKL